MQWCLHSQWKQKRPPALKPEPHWLNYSVELFNMKGFDYLGWRRWNEKKDKNKNSEFWLSSWNIHNQDQFIISDRDFSLQIRKGKKTLALYRHKVEIKVKTRFEKKKKEVRLNSTVHSVYKTDLTRTPDRGGFTFSLNKKNIDNNNLWHQWLY